MAPIDPDGCRREDLHNVESVLGESDDPLSPDGALDMVFAVDALHDIVDRVALLEHLAPSLRPRATVVIVDEDPEVTRDDHFLDTETIIGVFPRSGCERVPAVDFPEKGVLQIFRAQG